MKNEHFSPFWRQVLIALGTGAPAWAHHSFAAAYDTTNAITVHGVISQVLLRNPHSWFVIDVKDASGKVEQWSFIRGRDTQRHDS